jgi:FtsZ-binding cell division protein ZapB
MREERAMRTLRFLKLYLLSQNERAGLEISFNSGPTIVRGPNNHGKSAILKSLYDTFGAQPHRIDDSWKRANTTSVVQFSFQKEQYTIVKSAGAYSVFDAKQNALVNTRRVTDELGPFLAELLNFKLVMADKKDQVRIPPPAYMFAPFYVDQDHGWIDPWSSFARMYLPNSARTLSEYHSGIRPNEYYEAVAERDRVRALLQAAEIERKAISDAIQKVRGVAGEITLQYELKEFSQETDRLVSESQRLHDAQVSYRERLAQLNEERHLWNDQRDIINGAIAEMDGALTVAVSYPPHIECPTCGQEYENSLQEQFGLVEDVDGLIAARINASKKIADLDLLIREQRANLNDVEKAIGQVDHVFAIRKAELTFKDVVIAEGRAEAARLLQGRLSELDDVIGKFRGDIADQDERIKSAENRDRITRIKNEFADLVGQFAKALDVRLEDKRRQKLENIKIGRGSEGPRALLAYYFAFLRIASEYSSCAFSPIVIDAPNQQGQDQVHMPAMMRLMVDEVPKGAQLIIAAEDQFGLANEEIEIIDIGGQRDHVLRLEQFENVSNAIRPYVSQLL